MLPPLADPAAHDGGDLRVDLAVDDHLIEDQQRTCLGGLWRVVRDADGHRLDVARVLRGGQHALQGVVPQSQGAARVPGVHPGSPHLDEIPHLSNSSAAQYPGGVFDQGAGLRLGPDRVGRRTDPRGNHGDGVLVAEEIPLETVKGGFGEGQGRQGGANRIADCQRGVELTFLGGGYDDVAEPAAVAGALENAASLLEGVVFAPVVYAPSARDVVAKGVVEPGAFEEDVDIAPVFIAGVVAVFPSLPAVFVVEILRQKPLPAVGCQGAGMDAHPADRRLLNRTVAGNQLGLDGYLRQQDDGKGPIQNSRSPAGFHL